MKRFMLFALASLLSLAAVHADTGTDDAKSAAQAWLAVVDAGDYAKSWDEAAALFKQRVKKAEWEAAVGKVRGQTGAMKSREVESAEPKHKLPGVPDGDYIVMTYHSGFANYAPATEIVAAMRDADGQWRVAGYFVR